MSKRLLTLLGALCWVFLLPPSWAHNVIGAAYIEGEWIEGEVGFSNGEMALPDTPVQVSFNDQPVGQTRIGEDGVFRWKIDGIGDYRFSVDLSAGHVANVTVSEAEITELSTATGSISLTQQPQPISGRSQAAGSAAAADMEILVSRAVARQIKPLRKDINELRNKNELRDILAGLGLIAGLFGVLYGFAAHRKLTQVQGREPS